MLELAVDADDRALPVARDLRAVPAERAERGVDEQRADLAAELEQDVELLDVAARERVREDHRRERLARRRRDVAPRLPPRLLDLRDELPDLERHRVLLT